MSKVSEAKKVEKVMRERPIMLNEIELRLLHRLVDGAHRLTVEVGKECLEFKDLEARLAAAIELPVEGQAFREALIAMLPEALQGVARRLIVYHEGDEHVCMALWSEADVLGRAEERGIKITREQAQQILDEMDRHQDCEYGITWDTIDCYLDELKQ